MTSRCIISGDQPFFVFAVVSRKVSPKRHRFADLGQLPESLVVKTRRGMQSCRTALGRAMHVARCIRTRGVVFLFRLFTRCRCYTIRWCFSKGQGFLLQISPQDICLLATNFGTGADAVLAIEHVRLLIMIFTSVFVRFTNHQLMCRQFSPAYVASLPRSSSIRNSWLYLASRSDLKTHKCSLHWLKGCA